MEKERKYAIMADGSQIYYEKSGRGFPLFLLHGNSGSGKYFSKQVPELEKYFQIFLVDSRGHGRSTNVSKNLNFPLMVDDLKTIMLLENIRKADFLGFSDGANLAMMFTTSYPEYVHRLVLNAGNTKTSGVRFLLLAAIYALYSFVFIPSLFSKKIQQKLSILSLLLHDIGVSKLDLKQISCPTLILVGEHDIIKRKHSIYLAKTIPNASFVSVSGQGHTFARKNPQQFNQEILKFLKEKSS
ncbi:MULTISPECIES: alpha/beta fold hydrolase [Bacillus]|uniref:alpha/beta fold hydrolase n=1 Tax=Bacillus TaxID=1386 RepID=UPI000857C6FD|nr:MULTISPECIES: alpha/beta hydrolase [Bacillus]QWH67070.1 alpha/beta hydrolase [Bacillus wiedmannii]SCM00069.1 Alpha/beta hydrolase [Bacillus wiedmannii]